MTDVEAEMLEWLRASVAELERQNERQRELIDKLLGTINGLQRQLVMMDRTLEDSSPEVKRLRERVAELERRNAMMQDYVQGGAPMGGGRFRLLEQVRRLFPVGVPASKVLEDLADLAREEEGAVAK